MVNLYCVNKAKPELKCHGKCHLSSKFMAIDDKTESDTNIALSQLSESFYPVYFQNKMPYAELLYLKDDLPKHYFYYHKSYKYLSAIKILKPPVV